MPKIIIIVNFLVITGNVFLNNDIPYKRDNAEKLHFIKHQTPTTDLSLNNSDTP